MLTDTEIKRRGFKALIENLGDVNAEKFIQLLSKEPFDYTLWQSALWEGQSVKQVSEKAMKYRNTKKNNNSDNNENQ